MDSIGDEGTRFINAWSSSPWTPPSHASMFTGLLPFEHGLTSQATGFLTSAPSIAELLAESGYETVCFYSNPWLTDRMTGLMRGFGEQNVPDGTDTRMLKISSQGGPEIVSDVRDWLGRRSKRRPFFMFVNFLEAHMPYDPPASYRERSLPDLDPGYRVTSEWGHEFNAGLHPADDVDWDAVRGLYAGDVNTADAHLGEVLDELRLRGLYEDTVIIIVSDHGENLGEHGFVDHQFGVFETLIAVPLVIRAPGLLEPGVRTDPACVTDIFATILDATGVAAEDPPQYSRSLLGPPARPERPMIAQYAGAPRTLIAHLVGLNGNVDAERLASFYSTVRTGQLRLTVGGDGSTELLDFGPDPAGETNIATENPGTVNTMLELMPSVRKMDSQPVQIDEQMREWLRSLGYIM